MPRTCKDRCRYPERLGEDLGVEVKAFNKKARYPCRHYSACNRCEIMLTCYPGNCCPCCADRLKRKYFSDGSLTWRGRETERIREKAALASLMRPRDFKCLDCGVGLLDRWTKRCGPCKREHVKAYSRVNNMARYHRKRREAEAVA